MIGTNISARIEKMRVPVTLPAIPTDRHTATCSSSSQTQLREDVKVWVNSEVSNV